MICSYGHASKLNHQEVDRRFWSMVPLTRVTHFGYLCLTHSHIPVPEIYFERHQDFFQPPRARYEPFEPVDGGEGGETGLATGLKANDSFRVL